MKPWQERYHFPQELRQQAEAIENSLKASAASIKAICDKYGDAEEVHVVGSGDCYFISIQAAQAFRELCGVSAYGYEAYDYFISNVSSNAKTLVILFSSSGKSLYVLKSAEMAKKNGAAVIGMTNHADSPLGETADIRLDTSSIGVSKSFPSKTTTSALSLLYVLATRLGLGKKHIDDAKAKKISDEFHVAVPAKIREILAKDLPVIGEAAKMFLGARCYVAVGSGYARGTAMIGAAKMVETCREHVTFCNAEEYMHLHGFATKAADVVIVIGNNASNHREDQVVDYAQDQRARVLVVGDVPVKRMNDSTLHVGKNLASLSPMGASIASMVILHIFAAELSSLMNKDPDIVYEVNLKQVIEQLYTGPVAGWNV